MTLTQGNNAAASSNGFAEPPRCFLASVSKNGHFRVAEPEGDRKTEVATKSPGIPSAGGSGALGVGGGDWSRTSDLGLMNPSL